jgi:hypothetical protein
VQSFQQNLEDAGVICFFLLLKRLGGTARKVKFSLDKNVYLFLYVFCKLHSILIFSFLSLELAIEASSPLKGSKSIIVPLDLCSFEG